MIELPPMVQTVLPVLQTLNSEQKLFIIKNLLDDNQVIDDGSLAWQMGQGVFGTYKSGQGDLSQNAKSLVKQKIQDKYGKNTH